MTESIREPLQFQHGNLQLDRLKRKVTAAGIPVILTAREFSLLEFFLAHRGEVLTRERIARTIWETPVALPTNLIEVYVLRLRRKLSAAAASGPQIHTIRGLGYLLE